MATRVSNLVVSVAGLAALLCVSGCIERRLLITSDPPGATVWLNDVQIGTTPTEAEFRYFGTYDVRLHKQGFEPLATKQKADAPFYEWPGPDLVAEAMPWTTHTVVKWDFKLEPARELQGDSQASRADLIARGKELEAMVLSPEEKVEADKAAAEKAAKAAAEMPAEMPSEKPGEKPAEKASETPPEKAAERSEEAQPPIQPAKGDGAATDKK